MTETTCPTCGEVKERIAQHWAMTDCGYPEIPDRVRAVVDGLVLAGATVAGNGSNRHLTIGTTSEALAEWTADKLDWLCHGVRRDGQDGEREDVSRIRTPAHPGLNRYERWTHVGDAGGRRPPKSFTLTAATARVWWAFAGGLEWSGDYDSQRQGTFSAADPAKRDWIVRVLKDAGVESTPVDHRVKLNPSTLSRWLDWVGEPVPGVEHKWSEQIVVHRALRNCPKTKLDYRTALHTATLEIARNRIDGKLTPGRFDEQIDVVDAGSVREWLGGGSWESALRVANVPRFKDSDPEVVTPENVKTTEKTERAETIEHIPQAATDKGEPLTHDKYDQWARETDVAAYSSGSINRKWSWTELVEEAGVRPGRRPTRDDKVVQEEALKAIQNAIGDRDRIGTREYEEWQVANDSGAPSASLVKSRWGWSAACKMAGVLPRRDKENLQTDE